MIAKRENIRVVRADKAVLEGRLAKAKQFLRVAHDALELADDREVSDAAVTLYVHAGIAAADAICAAAIGQHAQGSDHRHAISLLATVNKDASNMLKTLLGMKTRAGYGYNPTSRRDLVRAERAASALVAMANI